MTATLNIHGYGLASALGLDALTCCASARAGVSRARSLQHSASSKPIIGHALPLLADEFCQITRLAYAITFCIEDLLLQHPDLLSKHRVALLLVLPEHDRTLSLKQHFDDEESYEESAEDFALSEQDKAAFTSAVINQMLSLQPDAKYFCDVSADTGAMALASAFNNASALLDGASAEKVVVLCADSLIDSDSVGWLQQTGRLKTDDNPGGLIPGEAACALLLGRTPGEFTVTALPCANESESYEMHGHSFGRAFNAALTSISPDQTSAPADVYFNHNGEQYFAHEWAYTVMHLHEQIAPRTVHTEFPLIHFGDIGLAFTGTAVILACQAMRRHYANSEQALIFASDTSPTRIAWAVKLTQCQREAA